MAESKVQASPGSHSLTAREFLVQNVYPDLRKAMELFLQQINQNGELAKFWQIAEENNAKLAKQQRRADKQRMRNDMGSEYETTGSTDEQSQDEQLSDLLSSDLDETGEENKQSKSKIQELVAQQENQQEQNEPKFNALLCLADKLQLILNEKQQKDQANAQQ